MLRNNRSRLDHTTKEENGPEMSQEAAGIFLASQPHDVFGCRALRLALGFL
jgi:hypothetical protein